MADLAVNGKTMRTTWVTVRLNAKRSDRIRTPISRTDRAGLELRGFRPGLTKRRLFRVQGGRLDAAMAMAVNQDCQREGLSRNLIKKGRIRLKTMFGLTISRPETI